LKGDNLKRVIVRYKVKAEKADENVRYIKKVFEELHQNNSAGLRYASFQSADGVSFVHIASIETDDGKNPLSESTAFKSFQAEIKDRCEEPPVAVEINEIGSYRFFGE
jgi:hypothetical protein